MAFSDSETYTNSQLLAHARKCLAAIMTGGQAVSLTGQILTRANLKDLRDTIDWLEDKVADADTASAGGIALVQWGEKQ